MDRKHTRYERVDKLNSCVVYVHAYKQHASKVWSNRGNARACCTVWWSGQFPSF